MRFPRSIRTSLRRRGRLLALLAAAIPSATPLAGADHEAGASRFERLFQPFRAERAALSPDGKYIACSLRENEQLKLALIAVDDPATQRIIEIADDAVLPFSGDREKTPVRLTYLRWARADRLVFATDAVFARPLEGAPDQATRYAMCTGALYAVNADGSDARPLAGPDDVAYDPSLYVRPSRPTIGSAADDEPAPPPQRLVPRSMRVIAAPLDRPEIVIVEAYGRGEARFEVNIDKGRVEFLEELHLRGRALYDQEGRPRVYRKRGEYREEFTHIPLASQGGFPRTLDKLIPDDRPLMFHVTAENQWGERSIPLGFGHHPDLLYFASNVGRERFGVYGLDLREKKRAAFFLEHDDVDLVDPGAPLGENGAVLDRFRRTLAGWRYLQLRRATHWIDPELAAAQQMFEQKFPRETTEILDWDEQRSRFLVLISSGADPGRFCVFHRQGGRLVELVRRAPWLKADEGNPSAPYSFRTDSGALVSGYVTLPRQVRIAPPPLIVLCHDGPWLRDLPDFHPEAQALAAMGLAVLQVNYRGSAGFGRAHRDAIRGEVDRAPLADISAAMDWMAAKQMYNPRRVAIMGEGFGGYLALRALQVQPDRFRCALAINAPTDLHRWIGNIGVQGLDAIDLEGTSADAPPADTLPQLRADALRRLLGADRDKLAAISPLAHPEQITKPVFLAHDTLLQDVDLSHATALRRELEKRDVPVEFLEIGPGFQRRVPGERARVFAQIEGFINQHVYDFKVQLGPLKKVGDAPSTEEETNAPTPPPPGAQP